MNRRSLQRGFLLNSYRFGSSEPEPPEGDLVFVSSDASTPEGMCSHDMPNIYAVPSIMLAKGSYTGSILGDTRVAIISGGGPPDTRIAIQRPYTDPILTATDFFETFQVVGVMGSPVNVSARSGFTYRDKDDGNWPVGADDTYRMYIWTFSYVGALPSGDTFVANFTAPIPAGAFAITAGVISALPATGYSTSPAPEVGAIDGDPLLPAGTTLTVLETGNDSEEYYLSIQLSTTSMTEDLFESITFRGVTFALADVDFVDPDPGAIFAYYWFGIDPGLMMEDGETYIASFTF